MKTLRRIYDHAKGRCNNPKDLSYKNYGGRGIKFLFSSFQQFTDCLGERPRGCTLDRINNDGHYEPSNVRWATIYEQANNKCKYTSTKMHKNNPVGLKGVCFDNFYKKWFAYYYNGKKNIRLYTGLDFFEACCVRKKYEDIK